MHHSFWDKHSHINSIIHRLDCRVKIIVFTLLLLAIVTTPGQDLIRFLLFGTVIMLIIFLSRLPLIYVLKRSLIVIPFVLLIAFFIIFFNGTEVVSSFNIGRFKINVYREGLLVFQNVLCKSWLSVLCLLILAESTEFNYLLKGLEKLRFPRIMILVISFFYRYVFILIDQLDRMRHAVESRGFKAKLARRIKILGSMIGWLFISTYDRAERVYMAMLSRGFTGHIHSFRKFKIGQTDIIFSLVLLSLILYIRIGVF